MEKTHTIKLTSREIKFLEYFLEQLSDEMGNAGCNDLPSRLTRLYTEEEGMKIAEETDMEEPYWPFADFCMVDWLKDKILKQVKP